MFFIARLMIDGDDAPDDPPANRIVILLRQPHQQGARRSCLRAIKKWTEK